MSQEIQIGEYIFRSTTDSNTITISDEKFAELLAIEELKDIIGKLGRMING